MIVRTEREYLLGNGKRREIAVASEVGRGIAAGAAGMTAMGALKAATRGVGDASDWREAPPAAKLGKRIIEGVSGRSVSRRRIGLLNNVMHVLYGPALGVSFPLVRRWLPGGVAARAFAFAAALWAARLAVLPLLGLRKPFWSYPVKANALDASYHVVYGGAVATVHRTLERRAGLAAEPPTASREIDAGDAGQRVL